MSTAGCTTYQVRGSCISDYMLCALTVYQGLYVQRFFLGALESGVSPGWMLVVGGRSSVFCAKDLHHVKAFSDKSTQDGTRNKNKHSGWEYGTA